MTFICKDCGKEADIPKRFRYKNMTVKEFLEKQEERRKQIRKILDNGCKCGGSYKLVIPNTKEGKLVCEVIKDI